jgi:hypothetical protein
MLQWELTQLECTPQGRHLWCSWWVGMSYPLHWKKKKTRQLQGEDPSTTRYLVHILVGVPDVVTEYLVVFLSLPVQCSETGHKQFLSSLFQFSVQNLPNISIKRQKVKLSLCFFKWTPCYEGVLGGGGIVSCILTLALDGGEWSASRPGRFTPRERAPGIHWIGGWVSPRAILDVVGKRKIPSPCQKSNPRTLIVQPIALCYTNWAIMALTTQLTLNNFCSWHSIAK